MSREMSYFRGHATTGTNLFAHVGSGKSKGMLSSKEESEGENMASIFILKDELKAKDEMIAHLGKKNAHLEVLLCKERECVSNMQDQIKEHEAKYQDRQREMEIIQGERSSAMAECKGLREQLRDLECKYKDMQSSEAQMQKKTQQQSSLLEIQLNTVKGQLSMECQRSSTMKDRLDKEMERVAALMNDVDFLTRELNSAEEDLKTEQQWRSRMQVDLEKTDSHKTHLTKEVAAEKERSNTEKALRIAAEAKVKQLEIDIQNMEQEFRILDEEKQLAYEADKDALKKLLVAQMKKSEVLTRRLERKTEENKMQAMTIAGTPATTSESGVKDKRASNINKKDQDEDIPYFMRL